MIASNDYRNLKLPSATLASPRDRTDTIGAGHGMGSWVISNVYLVVSRDLYSRGDGLYYSTPSDFLLPASFRSNHSFSCTPSTCAAPHAPMATQAGAGALTNDAKDTPNEQHQDAHPVERQVAELRAELELLKRRE